MSLLSNKYTYTAQQWSACMHQISKISCWTRIYYEAVALPRDKPSYRPQRSWGKVMFLHVSVILFRGGLAHCMLGYTHPPREQEPPHTRHPLEQAPQEQTPPEADTPRSRHPPGADTPQEQTSGTRHPPSAVHAGRYGQQAGGMHATGMQSSFLVCYEMTHSHHCSQSFEPRWYM